MLINKTNKTFGLVLCLLMFAIVAQSMTFADGQPVEKDKIYQVKDSDDLSTSITNTFKTSDANYYFLTQKDYQSDYKEVKFVGGEQIYKAKIVKLAKDKGLKSLSNIWKANNTIFVDKGEYIDDTEVGTFSKENLSIVGVDKFQKSIFKRVKVGTATNCFNMRKMFDYIHGHSFKNRGIYIENIVFDGDGYDLVPASDAKAMISVYGDKKPIEHTDKEVQGSDDFVLKNCEIKNIGSTLATSCFGYSNYNNNIPTNAAFQVVYSEKPVYIEGLTVKNVKGSHYKNWIVQASACKNVYIKNINIIDYSTSENSKGLKVVHPNNYSDKSLVPISEVGVTIIEDEKCPSSILSGFIQVGDYRYDNVKVPSGYKYVQYYNRPMKKKFGAYRVYKSYSKTDSSLDGRIMPAALFDRVENYWIVDENRVRGKKGNINSITSQLSHISKVRKYMKLNLGNNGKIPPFNVKLIVKDKIDSFSIPSFTWNEDINIVAVESESVDATEAKKAIDAADDFEIKYNGNKNVKLYNFKIK